MSIEAGFTGTRDGMTYAQKLNLIGLLTMAGIEALHLGDCVGADAQAYHICRLFDIETIGHPPTDPKLRAWLTYDKEREPLDYLERNRRIVDESTWLIATPKETREEGEALRSGTWATIRYAKKTRTPVTIIFSGGEVVYEGKLQG